MVAPNKQPRLYGLSDLKWFPLLTDEVGSSPTYGSPIDIPGVKSIKVDAQTDEQVGEGDEEVQEIRYNDKMMKITFEALNTPLDVMQSINGGTLDTTTDTDAVTYYDPETDDEGSYGKLEGLSKSKKEKIILFKVRGKMLPSGLQGGQFQNSTFSGAAIRTQGTVNSKRVRSALVQANYQIPIGGVQQVETATVAGTVSTAGNATFTVTAAGMAGSPKAISVAVALNDSAAVVAQKARETLGLDAAVTALFNVGGIGTAVVLTRKVAAANDATLNIAIANGTCAGLTVAATSANTTAGQA